MSFTMTMNGRRVEANEGEMVLAVARRVGIHIPTLCHHEAVEPFGSCRLCMVEVTKPAWNGWKGVMTACLYPAAPDLIIETDSERVHMVRRNVLDLLLARCPASPLIQKLAADYGVHQTTFTQRDNPDDCILCGLCVRICETAATAAIATVQRGHDREIGTPWGGPPPDCIGCLACAHICPTGHIKFTETAGVRRVWGREFKLARCETTKRFLPITQEQATFLARRQNLDPTYFAKSAEAQRKATAATFGRIARWHKLGLTQEEV
ncbi:MAG: 2Fe-2S iron-sulfur cluster-binding protein [Polyangiaceae bacterium]|nr:2Fe-2S iron-sulfur cluster-binding protein [Polyangiaceae bacterium]